jgi:hypothetical protein
MELNKPARGLSRRKFVKWGCAGIAGAVVLERAYDYFSESTAKAKIVIVGGGAAGITISAYLADMLLISFGDAAGLPTSKTGAAIRMQAPIAAANLLALVEGKEIRTKYNGYSACPIITEYGKVLMCEFGYDDKLMPTLPWLDPAVERGMWWTLKVHGLKPVYYYGMLKGLI